MPEDYSDWFPPEVLPVNVGFYDLDWPFETESRDWFDGLHWRLDGPNGPCFVVPPPYRWRGLSKRSI